MKKAGLLAIVICLFGLHGCAVGSSLLVPGGKPEVTILGAAEKREVMDILTADALAHGFQVGPADDNRIIFSKRGASNFSSSISPGSRFDIIPEARLTVNLEEVAGGIRVFCEAVAVTNQGSTYDETREIAIGKEAQEEQALREMQALLTRLKERLERR